MPPGYLPQPHHEPKARLRAAAETAEPHRPPGEPPVQQPRAATAFRQVASLRSAELAFGGKEDSE